jgi:hypothetical protein
MAEESEDFILSNKLPSLMIPIAAARRELVETGASASGDAIKSIEASILTFWNLMLRHSELENGVSYRAYEQLHLRISKSLSTDFSTTEAQKVSRYDWKADSVTATEARVSINDDPGEKVKKKFRAAAYSASGNDWQRLFKQYDKDGNGELDADEFAKAVRRYVTPKQMNDGELGQLFKAVDLDGGGTIGPDEFYEFFFTGALRGLTLWLGTLGGLAPYMPLRNLGV